MNELNVSAKGLTLENVKKIKTTWLVVDQTFPGIPIFR